MREAVTNLKWPLVQPFEAAPLRAGSVVLYSHNTFHRGNHRRDDWRTWQDNPRFMWRFWIYRTTDPASGNGAPAAVHWNELGVDPLTHIDLSAANDDVTSVWRYHHHWMQTGQTPPPRPEAAALSSADREAEANRLFTQLLAKGEEAEPARIGAAYKLASIGDSALAVQLLGQALYNDRESVRRAATYGLIAVGEEATDTLLEAANSPSNGFARPACTAWAMPARSTKKFCRPVATRLNEDPSVYVRAVAAGTLGCLGRRAVATGVGQALIPACLEALVQSLGREENRLAMDRAQGRSIKFARPTDECDVCEAEASILALSSSSRCARRARERAVVHGHPLFPRHRDCWLGTGADRPGLARGHPQRRERHLRRLCHGCAGPLSPLAA